MTEEARLDPSTLSDRDLTARYEMTDGDPEDPEAEALLSEIKRRGLDL